MERINDNRGYLIAAFFIYAIVFAFLLLNMNIGEVKSLRLSHRTIFRIVFGLPAMLTGVFLFVVMGKNYAILLLWAFFGFLSYVFCNGVGWTPLFLLIILILLTLYATYKIDRFNASYSAMNAFHKAPVSEKIRMLRQRNPIKYENEQLKDLTSFDDLKRKEYKLYDSNVEITIVAFETVEEGRSRLLSFSGKGLRGRVLVDTGTKEAFFQYISDKEVNALRKNFRVKILEKLGRELI